MNTMTVDEKKVYVKNLLKNYKKMNKKLERNLESIGIRVETSKKHLKIYCGNKLFICSSSVSDYRSGRNLASMICQELDYQNMMTFQS